MYPNTSKKSVQIAEQKRSSNRAKIIKKNYHVTAQTAYHITQIALRNNMSEGRVIDKLMRNYLAESGIDNL